MKEEIKNYVGIALIIGILLIGYAAVRYVNYYGRSVGPTAYRTVAVEGEGKIIAVPDVASFNFTVISEGGKDLAALQNSNNQKVNKAVAFLKSKGVDDKDIKTSDYRVDPRYQSVVCPRDGGVCPPASIVGYTVNQTVYVKARDIAKAGELLAGVVSSGANSVSGLQVVLDDPVKARGEARELAIKNAKEQAKTLAKVGDFRLGKLISINEGGISPYYGERDAALGMGGAETMVKLQAVPSSIEAGSQEVVVRLSLVYQIR